MKELIGRFKWFFVLVFLAAQPTPGQEKSASNRGAAAGLFKATNAESVPIRRLDELKLKTDSFTFVRLKYSVDPKFPGHNGNERWSIDYPESDRKFSAWFQKTTGLKTDPDGK